MSDPHSQDACPTGEQLNAWYDSELQDPEIEAHVRECPRCQKLIESYKSIDLDITDSFESSWDPAMGVRIRNGSISRIRRQRQQRRKVFFWVRIAACVAFMGAAIAVVFHLRRARRPDKIEDDGGHTTPLTTGLGTDDGTVVGLVRVATDSRGIERLDGVLEHDADVTHHVWEIDTLAPPLNCLRSRVSASDGVLINDLRESDSGRLRLLLKLTVAQRQELVDALAQNGRLTSAGGPRPGQSPAPDQRDMPVRYMIDLVRVDAAQ